MDDYRYVWLLWAAAFLIPWAALFAALPAQRARMWRASLATTPFGLTEPLFVPEYWNPPTVFDLAQRTGFDLESLVFCFAIGGIGVVMYYGLSGHAVSAVASHERAHARHRFHTFALLLPPLSFPLLYFLPWNVIYAAIAALLLGAAATLACRRDLAMNALVGAVSFLVLYWVFMLGLDLTAPGYIDAVWRLELLSGLRIAGTPAEELLFGFAFGAYWASVYEHLAWERAHANGGMAREQLQP